MNASAQMIEDVAEFTHDPLGHALYVFPWGEGDLLASPDGPRVWQQDILSTIGDHLQDPEKRHQPCMIAVTSGHGIGKSALVGMVVKWALDTHRDTRVVVTANTEDQLRGKTWPEVCKWQRMAITRDWFHVDASLIHAADPDRKESWNAKLTTWSKANTEAFAGLHNAGKRIVLIMDEASAIDDKVWEVAEGALTDADTEIIWMVFGNPTRPNGRLRECFRKHRKMWTTRQIDSRKVEGTNKKLFARWAETYGENSDFMKVRCRGIFPSMAAKQFINENDVEAAFGRTLRPAAYEFAPKIIGLDGSWEGDDELVIGMRQGLAYQTLCVLPKNDNDVEVANILARFCADHKPAAVFIDGGYGTGIYSAGKTMGFSNWQLVWFSGAASDSSALNKRADMAKSVRDWLKEGGAIPEDDVLRDELNAMETVPRLDNKLQIIPKDAIKKIIGRSPNRADCLMLTFGGHVHMPDEYERAAAVHHKRLSDHDPLGDF